MDSSNAIYQGLIAPCGMNCGLCIAYLREKKPCGGCLKKEDAHKPTACKTCVITRCDFLSETASGFCYDCVRYPCVRLKNLDKRYRSNYKMSMIENLEFIKNHGLDLFLIKEEDKWTCRICGARLCVHRTYCLSCKTKIAEIEHF
ncbi:MAG: DUF3795 domain-containing protein [Bacteroidales bacterium]